MYLWKDSRLRLRVTRLGHQYLIAVIVVGVLGVYTNNNLLYAVFGLMIGLLLVSGWVSRASIQSIEPVRVEDGSLFARLKGGLRLRLSDKKPKRARGLEIHLEILNCHAEPGFYPGGKGEASPTVVLQVRPKIRGLTKLKSVEVRTSHPFGFLEKTWRFPLDIPLLVAPHPGGYGEYEGGRGDFSEPDTKSGYSSPIGARPLIAGDSINQVHWKRTAQRGEPWVRVMEGDDLKGLVLELDVTEWEPGPGFERELERLSGAVLQARLHKTDVALSVFGSHGRTDAEGHLATWRALAPLEAEGAKTLRPMPEGKQTLICD